MPLKIAKNKITNLIHTIRTYARTESKAVLKTKLHYNQRFILCMYVRIVYL